MLCPGGQLLRNPTEGALAPLHRPGRADRPRPAVRRRGHRRRAGRARHLGLCGVGGAVVLALDCRAFGGQAGRLGADRELPRLPDRHLRHGADGPGLQPGAEVRRRDGDPRRGGAARMRRATPLPPRAGQRRAGAGPRRGDRDRRPLPPPRRRRPRGVRRLVGPLLGVAARGQTLPRAQEVALVGGGNSAGQATVFLAGHARARHAGRPPPARRDDVGLSGRAHRRPRQRRGRHRRRDFGARGRGRRARGDPLARPRAPATRPAARSATCSCSSAPIPTPTGCAGRASSSTRAASS